jgi:lipopolysaccharide export system permease protein
MLKVVDRYVGQAAITGLLAVWLIMTLFFAMFGILSELRDTQGDYGTSDALWFVALTTPRMAYQIFPVSALLGTLVGVGNLASGNELVAFRTSGVSRLRLALSAMAGALLITTPVVIMGEWVAPAAEQQARAFRLSEMVGRAIIGGARGMWIRDGGDIVNIQSPVLTADRGEQSVDFRDIVIYRYSDGVRLESVTRAKNATHDGDHWTLKNISTTQFTDAGAQRTEQEQQLWLSEIRPELLDSAVTRPSLLSIRSLIKYLDYLGENGLDDLVYIEAFWEKALYPLTVIALVLAGMPFVFGAMRSPNLGMRLFLGMILGGLFMIVERVIQQVASVYHLPTMAAQLLPAAILAIGAIIVLRRSV